MESQAWKHYLGGKDSKPHPTRQNRELSYLTLRHSGAERDQFRTMCLPRKEGGFLAGRNETSRFLSSQHHPQGQPFWHKSFYQILNPASAGATRRQFLEDGAPGGSQPQVSLFVSSFCLRFGCSLAQLERTWGDRA